jgi:predicted  nucleic acid-binding Zn-ribbon protein
MGESTSNVVQIDRVRCLECGTKYVKPADGGTVQENPGCPKCGYVGWISATIPATSSGPRRFGADRLPNQAARAR